MNTGSTPTQIRKVKSRQQNAEVGAAGVGSRRQEKCDRPTLRSYGPAGVRGAALDGPAWPGIFAERDSGERLKAEMKPLIGANEC